MYKDGTLTISYDTWKDGIAPSAYAGISMMRNLDPHSNLGALMLGKAAVHEAAFTPSDLPRHIVYDHEADAHYIGDTDGDIYRRTSSGGYNDISGPSSDCYGLVTWRNHLFSADDNSVDIYDISGSSWTSSWQSFSIGQIGVLDVPHTALVGTDDVVYFCDGNNIASLQEVVGQTFDPSNAATYTWNPTALDLPENYIANTLSEVGQFLVIGCYYTPVLNRGNLATIFPWDRISDSFNIPFSTDGNGVQQTQASGNTLYSLVDLTEMRLYKTNLSSFELIRELKHIDFSTDLYPNATTTLKEEYLFGVGSNSSDSHSLGVYGHRNGLMHLKHTTSQGDTDVVIGAICPDGSGNLLVSWENGSNHGIDFISDTFTTGYEAYVDTALYPVGTANQKKQFSTIHISLGKDLTAGQGVQVSYRDNLSGAFTVLDTYDFATYGAVSAIHKRLQIPELNNIQLRVALTSSGSDTPEFISLSLN